MPDEAVTLDLLWLERATLSVATQEGLHAPTWEDEPDGLTLSLTCQNEGCAWRGPSITWEAAVALQQSGPADETALLAALAPGVRLFLEWHQRSRP